MSVGRRRRIIVACVAGTVLSGLAITAFAVEEKKFKYKTIPADIVTLTTFAETDPSLELKREITGHSGPVVLDGSFTPDLTNSVSPLKLTWKMPKGTSVPFASAEVPELSNTSVTSISISLKGAIDCLEPPIDGSAPVPFTAMSGTAKVVYAAVNPATTKPFSTTAFVRLGPGHDPVKTDDISMAGVVTRGVGQGGSFILDGVMRPGAGEDWAGCQAGTDVIDKVRFRTREDTDGDGVPTPDYYRGGFALGYGSISLDGWKVGGRSDEVEPSAE